MERLETFAEVTRRGALLGWPRAKSMRFRVNPDRELDTSLRGGAVGLAHRPREARGSGGSAAVMLRAWSCTPAAASARFEVSVAPTANGFVARAARQGRRRDEEFRKSADVAKSRLDVDGAPIGDVHVVPSSGEPSKARLSRCTDCRNPMRSLKNFLADGIGNGRYSLRMTQKRRSNDKGPLASNRENVVYSIAGSAFLKLSEMCGKASRFSPLRSRNNRAPEIA
jgi:hypothetical protein